MIRFCLILLSLSFLNTFADDRPARPNIVLILTDDLGWQDVGCYDIDEPTPYETPNIDALAKRGVQFWQGYSPAPTCAPSRCAILSGVHPARAQKTHVVGGAPPIYSKNHPIITPWYSGRMPTSETTIAEALKTNGYTTGCIGKWHCAIDHHAYPQPADHGFDVSTMDRGATATTADRTKIFSTTDPEDPYQLDENGFPRHQNTIDAINFVQDHKDKPFFLYHANWLVHSPIHTRSEALLRKYCEKMDVPFPTDPKGWKIPGQKNPYYGAMVEALDYYTGQIIDSLDQTDDPRWPGHKLSENTYLIFTSDNGGFLGTPGEIYTSNAPLDGGKINAREGGTRVPLLIVGPGIAAGEQTQAFANGLDFYPTILSWTGTETPADQRLDGLDLTPFLDTLDPDSIKTPEGQVRNSMVWHFPHARNQSTIRRDGYKLIRKWNEYLRSPNPNDGLELFQLYDENGERSDFEEANNLAASMPELTNELNTLLEERLTEMNASYPMLNPTHPSKPAGHEKAPTVKEALVKDGHAILTYNLNGSEVAKAHFLYTTNGGQQYEEWFRLEATILDGKIRAEIPADATHYVFNFVDENHFLVSYPDLGTNAKDREFISRDAIEVKK